MLAIIAFLKKFIGAGDENRTRVLSLGSDGLTQTLVFEGFNHLEISRFREFCATMWALREREPLTPLSFLLALFTSARAGRIG